MQILRSLQTELIKICQNSCVYNQFSKCNHFIYYYCSENRCSNTAVQDVVFVIDTSGSIGSSNFQMIRNFVANITTELIQKYPGSAVGVILYSDSASIRFTLQAYTNLNALLSAIYRLPYSGGGTDTAEALTLLLSSAQNGTLGLRSGSSNVAIVITDGRSNNRIETLSAANSLHASNIFDVFAVGIDGADLRELQGIASSPEFVFFASLFNSTSLQQLQDRILPELCNGKWFIIGIDQVICKTPYYNAHQKLS